MTLIAAFHSAGVPVLVGDFLLTNQRRIGLRKKILRISENFVIGWCGHEVAAQSAIKTLQTAFAHKAATLDAVRAVLIKPETSDFGQVQATLIGWVVDQNGQHCFRWNSAWPHELFPGAPMWDGISEATAEQYRGVLTCPDMCPDQGQSLPAHQPVMLALTRVAMLMKPQLLGPVTVPMGHGFAYEILILVDGSHFEYVNKVLYAGVEHEFDKQGINIRSTSYGYFFKYEAYANYTLIHRRNTATDLMAARYLIPPPGQRSESDYWYRKCSERATKLKGTFPFESDHYCLFFRFKAPGFESPDTIYWLDHTARGADYKPGIPSCYIDVSAGMKLAVDRDWIAALYKQIRDAEAQDRNANS